MKKHILAAILISSLFSMPASAQFMHSVGVTISVLNGKLYGDYYTSNSTVVLSNATYFPRINVMETDKNSISIGAPVGVGFGLVRNSYSDNAGTSFSYDLPLVADFNFGCHSTKANTQTFGGYVGAGFGYSDVLLSSDEFEGFKGSSYGPVFRGGVRFSGKSEAWAGHSITIGLFYKKGIEKAKLSTFGLTTLFDL